MKAGDKIKIASVHACVDGFVGAIYKTADLERVPDAPHLAQVRAALTDGTWQRIAMLEYTYVGQTGAFMAFEDVNGTWWDLRGTKLAIEVEPKQADLFDTGEYIRRKARQYPN